MFLRGGGVFVINHSFWFLSRIIKMAISFSDEDGAGLFLFLTRVSGVVVVSSAAKNNSFYKIFFFSLFLTGTIVFVDTYMTSEF